MTVSFPPQLAEGANAPYLQLLNLFAYGTYPDYIGELVKILQRLLKIMSFKEFVQLGYRICGHKVVPILLMSKGSVMMSPLSFPVLVICFLFLSLVGRLLIFSKK